MREHVSKMLDPILEYAHPLEGPSGDFEPIIDMIGDAHYVLLGEASHGTHEFYRARAEITRRLIEEKDFSAVAVEADWPDAYGINTHVKNAPADEESIDALDEFRRFPTWMWRNADVLDFVGWLREHNRTRPPDLRVGFYGLDLYSLYTSIEAVIAYLEGTDPEAARRARERYGCFEDLAENAQAYGYAASLGVSRGCEDEVVDQLTDLRRRAGDSLSRDGRSAEDAYFYAEQNARLVKNAEHYYRAMFKGRENTWNLRDRHMTDTLEELGAHLSRRIPDVKVVVWAHNSHLGDARATEMGRRRGELNIGQLVREKHGHDAVLIGFSTYHGTVTAASDWGEPAERKNVRPGMEGSYEDLFHQTHEENFFLNMRDVPSVAGVLEEQRLERAIGVIYRPETERLSHYFYATLPRQFDGIIHFDRTRAVEPLERTPEWESGEPPETFPHGV